MADPKVATCPWFASGGEEGDATRYTARSRHWTEEARNQHEEMGFVQGWEACATQLAALCEGS